MKTISVICFLLICLSACVEDKNKQVNINFEIRDDKISQNVNERNKIYKAAISAMISPKETFVHYQELIDYLETKINHKIELVQRKTYQEVNNLIESGELDFAFICSGAYVDLSSKSKTEIIAVPLTDGKCFYQAYIISNKDSKIKIFEDFKGKSFAYTDFLSNTGRLYALKRVKEIGYNDEKFFSNIIYSNAHDNSVQLVNKGLVDGATVDGLIYEFMKVNSPEYIKNTVVIEKSEYYGIPPVVAKADKKNFIDTLRSILLNMDKDETGKKILQKIMIDKFVLGQDSLYNSIRKVKSFVSK
jgi:phosphonate transport system substrate-binding protein